MKIRIVCLANSIKIGGRCLAGIQLDTANKPMFSKGRPKWIRPISKLSNGEVPTACTEPFELLDVIEFEAGMPQPEGNQSENVHFDLGSLRKAGVFPRDNLAALCDRSEKIFGNRGKAVSEDDENGPSYSLMLISVPEYQTKSVTYQERAKPQIRIIFVYGGAEYDLSVTDPRFLSNYNIYHATAKSSSEQYLCLSLAVLQNGWYSKLVAGVLTSGSTPCENTIPDADIPF